MSCWIVSKTHIDALVHAGIDAELVRPEDADKFGRMLWAENLASVDWQYSEVNEVRTYSYEPMDGGPGITLAAGHVVRAAAECYDYQSCEHPAWEGSKAQFFASLLSSLNEHAGGKGPWGIGRRDAYLQ